MQSVGFEKKNVKTKENVRNRKFDAFDVCFGLISRVKQFLFNIYKSKEHLTSVSFSQYIIIQSYQILTLVVIRGSIPGHDTPRSMIAPLPNSSLTNVSWVFRDD